MWRNIRKTGSRAVGTFRRELSLRRTRSALIFRYPLIRIRDGAIDLTELSREAGRVSLVLEIGANNGDDTKRLLSAFPEASVHCFEPEPRAIKSWRANVRDRRATLHEVAICGENGTVAFHQSTGSPPAGIIVQNLPDGWDLSGSIHAPKDHLVRSPWIKFESVIKVAGRRLDEALGAAGISPEQCVDFIWMDVQGAERDVIRGSNAALARTRFIYSEYSTAELYEGQATLKELISLLPDFRIRKIWKFDVLFENTKLLRHQTELL